MMLFHTSRGAHWHMDRYCPRVASWQHDEMRPFERHPDAIPQRQRCSRCWRRARVIAVIERPDLVLADD